MTTCEAVRIPDQVPLHSEDTDVTIAFGSVVGENDRLLVQGELIKDVAHDCNGNVTDKGLKESKLFYAVDQEHPELRRVILQVFNERTAEEQTAADRQIQTHSAFSGSPGFLRVLSTGILEQDGQAFRYMELEEATGGNLLQVAAHTANKLALVKRVILDTVPAYQAMEEERVVYGDVKPENTLLRADGSFVISDLGTVEMAHRQGIPAFARATGQIAMWQRPATPQGKLSATIGYFAPEIVADGVQAAGTEADKWAFGVSLSLILTGEMPFETRDEVAYANDIMNSKAPRIQDAMPDCPVPLARVVNDSFASAWRRPAWGDYIESALKIPA